jgi:uracil-DNA glycosylase
MFSKLAQALDNSWLKFLEPEFEKPYMRSLHKFLEGELKSGKTLYPPMPEVFEAFHATPFDQLRVLILGQDPYHGPGQAHGLSFSVPVDQKIPPSLRNIYKELERDFQQQAPSHGCLKSWAEQGVLLLNACLTVEQAKAGAHQKKGWETFTDAVIQHISEGRPRVVFVLWGAYAQKKRGLIDESRHLVLTAPHPSPLSAHRGFIGCGHFSKVNQDLQARGQTPINWMPPL